MGKKMKELKAFDPASYDSIDLDRLVVYAMVTLSELGIELCLENIVVGAFTLFPKKFSLLGYPEFPDATRVEKSLWRSKGKRRQWIAGRTSHGYMITDRSRAIVAQTEAQLSDRGLRRPKRGSKVRRKEGILKETRESTAYAKFLSGQAESISRAELCYLLQGTLDSTHETLRENFTSLRMIGQELGQDDLAEFLNMLEERFSDILASKKR